MRFKPWGAWGALSLICALIVGCNNTNRQPEKTLGATTGNPPQGKAISSTGAPAFGAQNNKPFPTNGGQPNGQPYNNAGGFPNTGGIPNLTPPGPGGFGQPNAGNYTPKNFIPPTPGSSSFGNPPGLQPTPTPGSPFANDRITTPTDSPFPAVRLPGQP